LRLPPESDAAMAARLSLLEETQRALAERGILLVVALVPDKARVHEAYVRPADLTPAHAARYGKALRALQDRGVVTVDLLSALSAAARSEPVYYRTDTHWNQRGARVAAAAIAEAVRARGVKLPATRFREVVAEEAESSGDLVRLMGLEHAPRLLRPAPDRERAITIEEAAPGRTPSLFGDVEVPVVLLGTSYSMRASFHGFLQQALGARVLNAARDGAGFMQSAREYFADEAFRSAPPKVIVWEVPERVLSEKPGDEARLRIP
jgi:alginate O-acetyltransferase complex protein AlgJ